MSSLRYKLTDLLPVTLYLSTAESQKGIRRPMYRYDKRLYFSSISSLRLSFALLLLKEKPLPHTLLSLQVNRDPLCLNLSPLSYLNFYLDNDRIFHCDRINDRVVTYFRKFFFSTCFLTPVRS